MKDSSDSWRNSYIKKLNRVTNGYIPFSFNTNLIVTLVLPNITVFKIDIIMSYFTFANTINQLRVINYKYLLVRLLFVYTTRFQLFIP